jgi:hypothetical protein
MWLDLARVPFVAQEFSVDAGEPVPILMARSVYRVFPVEIQRHIQIDISFPKPARKFVGQPFAIRMPLGWDKLFH